MWRGYPLKCRSSGFGASSAAPPITDMTAVPVRRQPVQPAKLKFGDNARRSRYLQEIARFIYRSHDAVTLIFRTGDVSVARRLVTAMRHTLHSYFAPQPTGTTAQVKCAAAAAVTDTSANVLRHNSAVVPHKRYTPPHHLLIRCRNIAC
jgi:hypothetical protein